MPDVNTSPADSFICDLRVTPESVKNKLCKLNQNKSAGPDGLHPRILKELATPLSFPICMLLNKCFEHGKLPIDWKNSTITCIYIYIRREINLTRVIIDRSVLHVY